VNAFHVLGGLFAVWAVTLAAVGITREDFPATGRQAFAVGAVSVLLALSAIGSAVITGALEEEEEEEGAPGPPAAGEGERNLLRLNADPGGDPRFDRRSLKAPAGRVTVVMDNPSPVPHNVSLEGRGVDERGETVGEGRRSTVRAELRPGEYVFYCSVPGHRQAGMEGTLRVR
jgi:plastocyanin